MFCIFCGAKLTADVPDSVLDASAAQDPAPAGTQGPAPVPAAAAPEAPPASPAAPAGEPSPAASVEETAAPSTEPLSAPDAAASPSAAPAGPSAAAPVQDPTAPAAEPEPVFSPVQATGADVPVVAATREAVPVPPGVHYPYVKPLVPPKRVRSKRWLFIAIPVAAAVVIGILLFLFLGPLRAPKVTRVDLNEVYGVPEFHDISFDMTHLDVSASIPEEFDYYSSIGILYCDQEKNPSLKAASLPCDSVMCTFNDDDYLIFVTLYWDYSDDSWNTLQDYYIQRYGSPNIASSDSFVWTGSRVSLTLSVITIDDEPCICAGYVPKR